MGSSSEPSGPYARQPDRLGAYQLFRRIGRGGMAEVYVARKDGDLVDRELVVKRMLPHLADDDRFVQMFLREARIAMRLSHPNVVQMYEVGVEKEEHFIAMELLEGLSAYHLARRVWSAGRSLPLSLVARIVADAALGLHYAHTLKGDDGTPAKLVHRDVSADNIFVTMSGQTKLLDFGIAAGAFAGRVTRTGEIKGKVRYMSPEQLLGEDLDARADIFSLGVTLFWLLAGRYPFVGKNELVTMKAILEQEAPVPSSLNPEVPPKLDALVGKMLEKKREHRAGAADEVYEALLDFAGSVAAQRDAAGFMATAMTLPPGRKSNEEEETLLVVPATARSGAPSTQLPSVPPIRDDSGERPLAAAEVTGTTSTTPAGNTVEADPTDEHLTRSADTSVGAPLLEGTERSPIAPSESPVEPSEPRASVAPRSPPRAILWLAAAVAVAGVVTGVLVWPRGDNRDAREPSVPDAGVEVMAPAAAPTVIAALPLDAGQAGPELRADEDSGAEASDELSLPAPEGKEPARRASRRILARGPPTVEWRSPGGELYGKGTATLVVPRSAKRVVAVDTRLRGRVSLVPADTLDWASLPRGELAFVVLPYADVVIGTQSLGRTPNVAPLTVVAGNYDVELAYGTEKRIVKVVVRAGVRNFVRANMTQ